ncbi:Polyketide cyclase/dehydrase and lipid transport superfamily protein [Euphorbia peplus]|nr:Polyketide cyclase/dehydrase and lipid transport superfamily protein [Euphorbia peplus]
MNGAMSDPKWESEETAKVTGITSEQVWSLLSDFCNLQKYFPYIDTCIKLHGEDGKPGLVRRSTTNTESREFMADADADEKSVNWSSERLVMINHQEKCLAYEMLENNMGVKSYVATFKVVDDLDGGDHLGNGCSISWSYVGDPLDGLTLQEYAVQRNFVLQLMVQKIQAYFSVSASN